MLYTNSTVNEKIHKNCLHENIEKYLNCTEIYILHRRHTSNSKNETQRQLQK